MRKDGRADCPPVIRFQIKGQAKVVRAAAGSPYAEARLVHLPYLAPWVGDWIDEHAAFPNGQHDDWVDTTSMALLKMAITPSSPLRSSVPVAASQSTGFAWSSA